ncbi:MAG: YggT family protein [Alphaproteobacteria bacterium]
MALIGGLIILALQLYIFVIIIQVAMSWLVAFDIVNEKNEAAQNLNALTHKLTDPVYTPLRKFVPPIGGIDIIPLVIFIGVQILIGVVGSLFY